MDGTVGGWKMAGGAENKCATDQTRPDQAGVGESSRREAGAINVLRASRRTYVNDSQQGSHSRSLNDAINRFLGYRINQSIDN